MELNINLMPPNDGLFVVHGNRIMIIFLFCFQCAEDT